jgi:NTE family protein
MMKHLFTFLFFVSIVFLSAQTKIGLAMSGGGARGLAHIGMLKVIDELDIEISYISGTSIGAVIGGLYAMGYSAQEIEMIFLQLDWEKVMMSVIEREHLAISEKRWLPHANYYFDLNQDFIPKLPKALLSGNTLVNTFFQLTFDAALINHFDELPIPFRCVATNVVSGEPIVIEDWKLHEAMRASMSFPSLILPFEKNNEFFIDGGIRNNLPADIVLEMGADFVVGLQTSSGLKDNDNLHTLIDVLDQTINISINDTVEDGLNHCDIVLRPDFEEIHLLDFDKRVEIIQLGEQTARKQWNALSALPKRKHPLNKIAPKKKIELASVQIRGNHYLSNAKAREYLGLKKGNSYSLQDITEAFEKAYHSSLFSTIYPTLQERNGGIELIAHVIEKPRNRLGFGFVYRNENEMAVNIALEMNNYFQPNSKFITNLTFGAENELNLDYVKNFGKYWGVYFRLFPYLKECKLFTYNEEHQISNSVRSLEYGATGGIGAFAEEALALEFYGFADKTRLYQNIGEFENTQFTSCGLGVKLYHESLDNLIFPRQGAQGIAKFTINKKSFSSDDWIQKFYGRIRLAIPFNSRFACEYKFEYGSYFKPSEFTEYYPFYIGGIDSFVGFNRHEKSAPIFKINAFHLRYKITKNTYAKLTFNVLQLGNTDKWDFFESDNIYGGGFELAYDGVLVPFRAAITLNESHKANYYISIGYDFDAFEFSRK